MFGKWRSLGSWGGVLEILRMVNPPDPETRGPSCEAWLRNGPNQMPKETESGFGVGKTGSQTKLLNATDFFSLQILMVLSPTNHVVLVTQLSANGSCAIV